MSLINDVLRDLDRRGAPRGGDAPGRSAPARRGPRAVLLAFAAAVGVAGVAAAVLLGVHLTGFSSPDDPARVVAAPLPEPDRAELAVPEPTPVTPADADEAVAASGATADAEPPRITDIRFDRDGERASLQFKTEHPVVHDLDHRSDGTGLTLTLPAQLRTRAPDLLGELPPLEAVDWRSDEAQLHLELLFRESVRVAVESDRLGNATWLHMEWTDAEAETDAADPATGEGSGDAELADAGAEADSDPETDSAEEEERSADAAPPAEEPDTEQEESSSPSVTRSADEYAGSALRQGNAALRAGERRAAEAHFQEAVDADPDAHEARLRLARLQHERGASDAARDLLDEGLARADPPVDARLAETKARILLQASEPERAVRIMERHRPDQVGDGNWHALLAALYRQTGEPEAAAETYQRLVEAHAGEALWWLGLGASLDDAGDGARAISAYRRALEVGGLDAELVVFARERIEALE